MSIDREKKSQQARQEPEASRESQPPTSHGQFAETPRGGAWAGSLGILVAGGFYAVVATVPWAPLQRYFLGHPVAIAATVLFWIAAAVLLSKWFQVSSQWSHLATIRDEDLMPPESEASPAGRWRQQHDAGYLARGWLAALDQLPRAARRSQLVVRLGELLMRQSQRGTTKHLADDLRELSARDADLAHDSLGLVRIIVWAIPMLGFLGTVIGITQTLGGLDFTDGAAAVDRLKSGLYVAFDTTALGLVLSVVAIFLQFPVERSEQRLLASIDGRVGHLASSCLPSDEVVDNQNALVAELCEGIQAAVAESLAHQADLWRGTIDEAHQHWQDVHAAGANQLAEAFQRVLTPALENHANSLERSADSAGYRLERQVEQWQQQMGHHSENLQTQQHALAEQCQRLVEANQQQCQQLVQTNQRSEAIQAAQVTLEANLGRLQETNAAIDRSVSAAAGDGMADAMRFLARAVDALSAKLPQSTAEVPEDAGCTTTTSPRRAA